MNGATQFERNSNKWILRKVYGLENAEDNIDVEEMITKLHWVKERGDEVCFVEGCGRVLGMRNGKHHCRKLRHISLFYISVSHLLIKLNFIHDINKKRCGQFVCDIHGNFQIRLFPKTAAHDPIRGLWYRSCQTCYLSREGYNDTQGVNRKRMGPFLKLRRLKIEHAVREAAKLQKRVEKLVFALQDAFEMNLKSKSGSSMVLGLDPQISRDIERSIVHWEDDKLFTNCPMCG